MAKKKGFSLSAFSILYILLILLAIVTWFIPSVKSASLGDVVMASFKGFQNASDVCLFVLVLGGLLGIVTKTNALSAGIAHLVKKLKGRELILIPILMLLLSIGGTTYGMAEETVAFYALLVTTMVAAGFDSLVGASTVLLGAGVGVLGSTVNPFATGIASSSINESFKTLNINATVNNGQVIILGTILWLTSLAIACTFVLQYAKKVKKNKGSTILSLQEQQIMEEEFGKKDTDVSVAFTSRMRLTLIVFAISFVVMIIAVIPWADFNVTLFEGWSSFLTGASLGSWWFGELSMWFLIIAIVIGLINGFSQHEIIDAFIAGAKDMLAVILVIAVSRGVSTLMADTELDKFILNNASSGLQNVSTIVFAPASYLLYLILSFFIPSTSGLANVSMPIMGPLSHTLHYSTAVMVMIFSAASGLINLFTPTSGVVMGGLAIARIEYSTWIKFVAKVVATLFVVNIIILTIAMFVFSR